MSVGKSIRISIVVPVLNEAACIGETLKSLAFQADSSGNLIDGEKIKFIVVDNGSTDATTKIVREFALTFPKFNVEIISERKRGVVHARIKGFQHSLEEKSNGFHYLVGVDADTYYPQNWLASCLRYFNEGNVDVCSSSGFYPPELWLKAPRMAQKYFDFVGTIFFHPQSIEKLGFKGRRALFTEQIFRDFPKPMADCGIVISEEMYRMTGGYRVEFAHGKPDMELLGEGWRLKFQVDHLGGKVVYVDDAPFITSPRRLLRNAKGLFDGTTYHNMQDFRLESVENHYESLDLLTKTLDFHKLRKYVVRNYILLQCLTTPGLVDKNRHYFGDYWGELSSECRVLRSHLRWQDSNNIYEKCDDLAERYFEKIVQSVQALELIA